MIKSPLVLGMVAVALSAGTVSVQGPPRIGTSPISHIGVAVADVEASARAFADVFDVPVPMVNNNNRLAAPNGGETAVARAATIYLPNFLIEMQQSATDFGPIHDTFTKFGRTVHHISFGIRDSYGDMRDLLVQKGGTWRGGTRETGWAYVDFRERLGVTFEPISIQIFDMLDKRTTKAPAGATLGTQPVTRVGIVVRNVDDAAKAYADILGVTVPPARVVKMADYAPGSKYKKDTRIKVTSWTHENGIAIELVEPVGGPSPWSDALAKQGGNAVHHVTFNAGDRYDDLIRLLQSKGGTLTYGRPGGNDAYLDFTDKLGITIELTRGSQK